MFYRRKSNYSGRWFVKFLEGVLIFGVILFGIDALNGFFAPTPNEAGMTIYHTQGEYVINLGQSGSSFTDVEYHDMGFNHQIRDEYLEAVHDYSRALTLNPDLYSSRLNRGVAYEQLGYSERAAADFNAYMNRDNTTRLASTSMDSDFSVSVAMHEGRVYEFPFYAEAGQAIYASVLSAHQGSQLPVDPLIVVVDDYGNPIAGADDILLQDGTMITMDSVLSSVSVPHSGYYTLRVSHAGGNPYGAIDIEFKLGDGLHTDCGK